MSDYNKYLSHRELTKQDVAWYLEQRFPKFIKGYMSAVCNPEEYGIQLTPDAEEYLVTRIGWGPGLDSINYPDNPKPKKKPKRTKRNQLTIRLDDALASEVKQAMAEDGIEYTQAFFEQALISYLEGRKDVSEHEM